MNATQLTKTLGDQVCTVTLEPGGTTALVLTVAINGDLVDAGIAEYDSAADRDASLAETVASYIAAGYEKETEQ